MSKDIVDVRKFWEKNPLWTGESPCEVGTREFFEDQKLIVAHDCFAGKVDERLFPKREKKRKVLDLGCGCGQWTVELWARGCQNIVAADLTYQGLKLTQRRCSIYRVQAKLSQQNAERLGFRDGYFSHVNCQGVIHHTPDTDACIREIARVLEKGGTACISVYHNNLFLKTWPILRYPLNLVLRQGGLRGRGREGIFKIHDVKEIIRVYDGYENPIGKAYSKKDFIAMLLPYFTIEHLFLHFFPARALPFGIPPLVHRLLDKRLGFMIYAMVKKT